MSRVHCLKSGCHLSWEQEPTLGIDCPTCKATVGEVCKRPSGHRVWGGQPHPARDIAADKAGLYGTCPLGLCGLEKVRAT